MEKAITIREAVEFLLKQDQDAEIYFKDSMRWEARPCQKPEHLGSMGMIMPDEHNPEGFTPCFCHEAGTKKVFLI